MMIYSSGRRTVHLLYSCAVVRSQHRRWVSNSHCAHTYTSLHLIWTSSWNSGCPSVFCKRRIETHVSQQALLRCTATYITASYMAKIGLELVLLMLCPQVLTGIECDEHAVAVYYKNNTQWCEIGSMTWKSEEQIWTHSVELIWGRLPSVPGR